MGFFLRPCFNNLFPIIELAALAHRKHCKVLYLLDAVRKNDRTFCIQKQVKRQYRNQVILGSTLSFSVLLQFETREPRIQNLIHLLRVPHQPS